MDKYKELANLIFPNIKETIADLEKKYPNRNLKEGAEVTRFAPSPTGFLHTGSLFTALISKKIASDTNGIFYLRIEDTDTKREIKGSIETLIKELDTFEIRIDEGVNSGNYGPYKQSARSEIYDTVLKEMIAKNLCYPAFDTEEELAALREEQLKKKINPGYYGEYAPYRNKTPEEYIELVKSGKPYVLRFRSNGNQENKIEFNDLIRGKLFLTENNLDIVVRKSDNLPTYHFAHLVDDHFMRTTIVSRGEEWLSSLPIHLQLFDALGFKRPKYMHLPVIMKNDNGTRRKLSKRKDVEASVSYFIEQGYPIYALIEYLLTLANSNYEEWRNNNLDKDYNDFKLSYNKFSLDGALFDLDKIKNIAKERLALKTAEEVVSEVYNYARIYDKDFATLIENNPELTTSYLNIGRNSEKPRKDFAIYSEVYPHISFMYPEIYDNILKEKLAFNENINTNILKEVIKSYSDNLKIDYETENDWFTALKELGVKLNFATNNKEYKENKEKFNGTISDLAEIVRVAITTKKSCPSLYEIQKILGLPEVKRRLEASLKNIEESK